MIEKMGIPSVDLNTFKHGSAEEKLAFVHKLGEAFETVGFVAVKNHGLTHELITELYKEVKAFFELPESVKKTYEIEGLGGQRGYTSFGKEHAKGSNAGDLKEFWHFGQEVSDGDPVKSEYPDNIKCKEVPGFDRSGMAAYRALEECGKHLLRAIAVHLDLEEQYFDKWIHNGNSILRPIHYPPITSEPQSAIRAGAHEDINLITLLIGASAEGLEILNKQGEWVAVTAVEDHIVVNVGDMLQRLTNSRLKSTTHRVVNPVREKWHLPRYSIPFFMHPKSGMPLNALSSCVTDLNPKHFEDISAGDYLYERLVEIGLIKVKR